jgi:hypothetical protein
MYLSNYVETIVENYSIKDCQSSKTGLPYYENNCKHLVQKFRQGNHSMNLDQYTLKSFKNDTSNIGHSNVSASAV